MKGFMAVAQRTWCSTSVSQDSSPLFLGFTISKMTQERQQPAMPVLFPFVPPFFFSMCVRVSLPATYYAICVHPPINDWAPALISLLVAV